MERRRWLGAASKALRWILSGSVAFWLALPGSGYVCAQTTAQSNEWAWMGGAETQQPPVYGTMGIPAAANMPPGLGSASSWTDLKGNLWLFGGSGVNSAGRYGYLNDVWEYSPAINQWAWMGGTASATNFGAAPGVPGTLGIPAAGNIPGGRSGAASWTDANGNLWLFGGGNYVSSQNYFNDLWEFNPSTNQWAWMNGTTTELCASVNCGEAGVYGQLGVAAPGNYPGSRSGAQTWTDSRGNLWLFGGYGRDSGSSWGYLNDIWEFSPATNQWAWMGGSNTLPIASCCGENAVPGVYGTLGTPTASNTPGSRSSGASWVDRQGNLWLFGGYGSDSAGILGYLNDLWKFNPSTGQWAWMGGTDRASHYAADTTPTNCSNSTNPCITGVYGTLQVPAAGNVPGARSSGVNWTDSQGNFWLFGGNGTDSAGISGELNDVWKFNPGTNQWAWMGGSNIVSCAYSIACGEPGTYGTSQTPALGNIPSGRTNAVGWTDRKGNFWLFGGNGIDVVGTWVYFSDLWEFEPNTSGSLPITAPPTFTLASGTYTTRQTVAIYDATPGATIQYLVNGNAPAVPYTTPLTLSSSETIEAIAGASGYANSDIATASYVVNVPSAAAPVFSPGPGTYATAQTVTISDATAGTTIYYTTDGTTPTTSSSVYRGPIAVSSSETILAIAIGDNTLNSATASAVYTIGSSSTLGQWAWMGGSTQQNQPGVYGTLGTPAAGNIPGARNQATSWTDPSGNFWLFGGFGRDGAGYAAYLNDLWEFNPSTRQWAWMGGGSTVSCNPCSGRSGVYGTLGTPAAGNTPGGRNGAAGWTDSGGHLWLFGGYGIDGNGQSSGLNDLWEFDPTTLQWTWMGGSSKGVLSFYSTVGAPGVYGTLGTPAPGNIPGSRYGAASWMDNQGHFWLYGGTGQDATGDGVTLDDLWEFDPSTKEWTWFKGNPVIEVLIGSQPAVYNTLGVPSADTAPGSLTGASGWTDTRGNLWMFGNGNLWEFDTSIKQWAWVGGPGAYCVLDPLVGANVCTTPPGAYGTLGLPAAGNFPGSGNSLATWTDHSGNFWLFGGNSSDVTGEFGGFYRGNTTALWIFNPVIDEWTWMGGDYAASNCSYVFVAPLPFVVCDGSQGVLGSQSTPALANVPPARIGAAYWTDKSGNLWLFSGQVTDLSDNGGNVNDLWEYQPSLSTFPPATTPIFSLKAGTYVKGGPLTISNGMANASIYYTTDGTTPTTSSTLYSGPITVSSSETIQAMATAPGYRNSGVGSATYVVVQTATPATPMFSPAPGTYTTVQSVSITESTPGAAIYYTTDGTMPEPNSPVYAGPITVSSPETITALGVITVDNGYTVLDGIAVPGGGYVISSVASATYTVDLPPAATPVFSIPSGTYPGSQTVTLSDTTTGATIYYTTDGTTPTTTSIRYTGSLVVFSTETIRAIAVATGYSSSAVASATYTINIAAQDFSVTVSPPSLAIAAGHSGTTTISVTPLNGFSSAVSFSCSGLLFGTSCSFAPAVVTPSGTAVSTTLTLTASASASSRPPHPSGYAPVAALALTLCFLRFRRLRRSPVWMLCVVATISLLGLSACGSGTSNPESGTVTVTASSGSLSHSATLSVSVN